MRITAQSLAEEYFALTGRPMATMTVSEFIAFKQAAAASFGMNDADFPLAQAPTIHRIQNTSVSETRNQNTPAPYNNAEKVNNPDTNNSTELKPTIPPTGANVIPMQGERNKKNSNEHALALLQSING